MVRTPILRPNYKPQKTNKMKVEKNHQGLAIVNFEDKFKHKCSLQKSGDVTKDCVWLGMDKDRMCLTQQQMSDLLPYLINFVKTGNI